jgi:hypothetical protein
MHGPLLARPGEGLGRVSPLKFLPQCSMVVSELVVTATNVIGTIITECIEPHPLFFGEDTLSAVQIHQRMCTEMNLHLLHVANIQRITRGSTVAMATVTNYCICSHPRDTLMNFHYVTKTTLGLMTAPNSSMQFGLSLKGEPKQSLLAYCTTQFARTTPTWKSLPTARYTTGAVTPGAYIIGHLILQLQ